MSQTEAEQVRAEDALERAAIQHESQEPAPSAKVLGQLGRTYGPSAAETRRARWSRELGVAP